MTEDSCDKLFIDDEATNDKLVIDVKEEVAKCQNNENSSNGNNNDICNTPPVSPITRTSTIAKGGDDNENVGGKYEVCVVPSVAMSGSPSIQGNFYTTNQSIYFK